MNSRDSAAPSDETSVEAAIQVKGLNAPRLTPGDIDAVIVGEDYHVFPGTTLTVCRLTLRNGFSVTGESAAASIENFDEEIGRQIARRNARDKIWSLEGYLLRERLWILQKASQDGHVVEVIASVCHEINRAYCAALGDDSQLPWDEAPDWQKDSARNGVKMHLSRDVSPEESHASWLAQKVTEGWVYGPIKDAEKKEHPCMRPYEELPVEQRAKDHIFRAVVRSMKR